MMAIQKPLLVMTGLLLITSVMTVGCEETFEPMQENDRYIFSFDGYLDASLDRQWIRVSPVRDTLFMGPGSTIDATVTLEHLESGRMETMTDSLHQFAGDNYAFNFWTDMKIEPDQAYKITAERSDGYSSSATVTLPPDYPVPIVQPYNQRRTNIGIDTLRIHNIEHLVDVVVNYQLEIDGGGTPYTFHHLEDTLARTQPQLQPHIVHINQLDHLRLFNQMFRVTGYSVISREIRVSVAGPDWLFTVAIDDDVLSLPEGASNVENGTGYLMGILSKTIPYEEGLEYFGSPGIYNN